MRFQTKLLVLSLAVLLVSACRVGKNYKQPTVDMPATYANKNTDSTNVAALKWWEVYKDTLLVSYIQKALEHNNDLKMAVARMEEYRALRRVAESDLLPSIGINGFKEYEDAKEGGISENNYLRGELSWELDVWGRLRWQREAGIADFRITEEEKNAVYQSLVASVAITYFELMAAKRELEIVSQTGEARREGVRIAELRYKGGLTAETQYRQSEVELAKTLTLIPEAQYTITQKSNLLATLMGEFPASEGYITRAYEHRLPDSIPAGLPSQLLLRRPDLRKAEQEVIVANAEVGMALTNMFPKISLTARYGYESGSLNELLSSPFSYLSGQLLTPVFNAGANRAKHRAAKYALEQKALNYDQRVLKSFEETSNSLAGVQKANDLRTAQTQLENASRNYLKLAELQYINGVVTYLDVLDAQRQLFDAELKLNNAVRDLKIAYVNLYKALGGGW